MILISSAPPETVIQTEKFCQGMGRIDYNPLRTWFCNSFYISVIAN